ncbi:MAG: hypothetical protein M0Z59_09515 [Nitrospiraceae bacterium]|nr:hypothetical protein [Nitrospiraceae bacterium]
MDLASQPPDWARAAWDTRKKLFSELDVLLKALDCYFAPENHAEQYASQKDFSTELGIARDASLRVLSIVECIMPESRKNAYWFQKFAEQRLLPAGEKDSFKKWMYSQDTLEKSIYLLYDSFINIKSVITEMLKTGSVNQASFMGIGRIMSREIRANRYLNPFRKSINPEFDAIENPEISALVKGVPDRAGRKLVSTAFLYLFRFLRYLSNMDMATQRPVPLHTNYLILLLLRHEINVFLKQLEASSEKTAGTGFGSLLGGVVYQFQMEQKRVFRQELRDLLKKTPPQQRGKIENGHGILKNLTEQVVIVLAQHWKPSLRGEDIFESFMTKFEQSMRLREDIAVLHRFLALFEKKGAQHQERHLLVQALQNYMQYFESFTFRLLRYEDYEEFASFFLEINRLARKPEKGFERLFDKCMQFKIYLETTLRHIENRAELQGRPLDAERVDAVIKQYLTA